MPLRDKSRLIPAVALTCGRPAAFAIATSASVARSDSRCPLNVGFDLYVETSASRSVSADAVPASRVAAVVARTSLRITAATLQD
jgi:hypothetical protein